MAPESRAWLRRLKGRIGAHRTVSAWKRFGKEVRSKGCHLLSSIHEYPGSILVAGCQRSGTTMLARVITSSEGMVEYYHGVDDELDAAMMLSGKVGKPGDGRYCFQTTYVNECYKEYLGDTSGASLIWVLRNPYSVVHSFIYNWPSFALNELSMACGVEHLSKNAKKRFDRFGVIGLSRLERACVAYAGKTEQALILKEEMPEQSLLLVEYDQIVLNKEELLPKVYNFVDLPYRESYAERIHSNSLRKKDNLSEKERSMIEEFCVPVYESVLKRVDL